MLADIAPIAVPNGRHISREGAVMKPGLVRHTGAVIMGGVDQLIGHIQTDRVVLDPLQIAAPPIVAGLPLHVGIDALHNNEPVRVY
ncbi:hypothetical protein D3C75_846580 [compost metagenome]